MTLFNEIDKICRVHKGNVAFLISCKHSFRNQTEYIEIECLCSDVVKHVQLSVILLKYTRNLQEDLESQLDLEALFHLSVPGGLQGLVPQWDLLLPNGLQREMLL